MARHTFRLLAATLCCAALVSAQDAIRYFAESKIWLLTAGPVSYAFGVNERGDLQHLYWGRALWRGEDLAAARSGREWASFDLSPNTTLEEYPGWGGGRFIEPAAKITLASGVRDLVLRYQSHEIQGDTLKVRLRDLGYDFAVTLVYKLYPDGIVRRHAVIENHTQETATVESAQSAAWYVPPGDGYRLSYLSGRWAGETQLVREDLHPGMKVIESRRGNTGQVNPWFAIDGPARATEEAGRVWFGAIGWSGNWRITVEQTPHQQVRVTGGMNSFDFSYPLKPGETLETPPFYAGYTEHGFGGASRMMHRFERASILPRQRVRPVLYNSWEATEFAVDEPGQKALATKAASIGVERFVMDDGWFGARNHDRAGLGDWTVNPKKFPNGLKPLIDHVKSQGMDFGLWVEPEMVNPDSDLYRAHPDWAMHMEGRPRTPARNQLVLNVARDDVKEYLFGVLDKLVTDNEIAFLKWDMNRHFSEPGWPEAAAADQRKLWVKYVRNLYEIIDRLRAKHPNLEIESCSGGGGRVDLGILSRVEQVWTSDNTDALDRLKIQEGFTQAYTPQVMMAWVTDVPHWLNLRTTSLEYRMLSSMQGSLGIGANIAKWNDAETATAKRLIAEYHKVQPTIVQGDLYRLNSPRNGSEFSATQTVNRDKSQSVVFLFIHSTQEGRMFPRLKLEGLDPAAEYTLTPIEGKAAPQTPTTASGAWWMNHGFDMDMMFRGDFKAAAFRLDRK